MTTAVITQPRTTQPSKTDVSRPRWPFANRCLLVASASAETETQRQEPDQTDAEDADEDDDGGHRAASHDAAVQDRRGPTPLAVCAVLQSASC
jgi:hypothetical protein